MGCSRCGAATGAGSRFCQDCGALLASAHAEGERKHVTVLFVDVVGFTALSERLDPEAVRELMEGCFVLLSREITRFGGTVNTFTGDGLMALFGAPEAYADHAARAAHAACGIEAAMGDYAATVRQRWAAAFQVRVGLHTGLVVIGRVAGSGMDFTAMGDAVNLAARLQVAARPGHTCASNAVRQAAGPEFAWSRIGALEVKGKTEPVESFELTGVTDTRNRFPDVARRGLTGFVGRDAELGTLVGAWERAASGAGQVVSVVGEAGLGKSRLLYEFRKSALEPNAPLHEGSCFSHGEVTAYLPFLKVVRSVCGLNPTDAPDKAIGTLQERLATLDLSDEAVFLRGLLGLPTDDTLLDQLSAAVTRQRTVESIRNLLVAAAAEAPMVVVVEDVHWVDTASEEVLAALVEALPGAPLLLVLAYRPEYLATWGAPAHHAEITLGRLGSGNAATMIGAILRHSFAQRVALEGFTLRQSEAMLADLLGPGPVPPGLAELVLDRTDGNPLFVEELVRTLLDRGVLKPTGSGYDFSKAEDVSVPTSVQGVLLERVDRLNPAQKAVLQAASVLGRVFPVSLLREVAAAGPDLERLLAELCELEFLYPTGAAPETAESRAWTQTAGEYSFKHVLTQEAVYETLVRARRESTHDAAGAAIERLYPDRIESFAEELAHHYLRSANAEKALQYSVLANRKAIRANAVSEAKLHYRTAMRLLDNLPDTPLTRHQRVALLADQFVVFWLTLELPDYLAELEHHLPVAETLGDPGLFGLYLHQLGHCRFFLGDTARGIDLLRASMPQAAAGGNLAAVAMSRAMLATSLMWTADFAAAEAARGEALEALAESFDLRFYLYIRALAGCWGLALQGRWAEAVTEGEDALRTGERYRDDSVISFAAMTLSHAYIHQGDLARAEEYCELASAKALTPADRVYAATLRAFARCRAGRLAEAIDVLEELVPVYSTAAFPIGQSFVGVFLGEAYWRAGRLEDARRTLELTRARALRCELRFYAASAERLLAEVTEDPILFERAAETLEESGANHELALALAGHGDLLIRLGRPAEGRPLLDRAAKIYARLGTALRDQSAHART